MKDRCFANISALEKPVKKAGIRETYRGRTGSKNCREWAYFDCRLDVKRIREDFRLADCVKEHSNDDRRSGLEAGLVCDVCHDAVMGVHASLSRGAAEAFPAR